MKIKLFLLILVFVTARIVSADMDQVYDERADARKDIRAAVASASGSSKPRKNIALVFGANWCFDCRMLEAQMHIGDLAQLIEKSYVVVKIDVGRMDKNIDVASKYDVPIKNGIPAVAILDARGKLLFAQDQGQFADARNMSYESIKAFFEEWKPKI
ncbi:MAG: thioredoxin family protein [Terriglobia bacterium]|jgi:protein disulfide-isomerase